MPDPLARSALGARRRMDPRGCCAPLSSFGPEQKPRTQGGRGEAEGGRRKGATPGPLTPLDFVIFLALFIFSA